jgi:hypothetical protein
VTKYTVSQNTGAYFEGNRSLTVTALIGAARVNKRFPDTLVNF